MGQKILIIDDEPCLLGLLEELFSENGFDVVCANNGNEALDLFDNSFHCVLTDLQMPQMNGVEFLNKIKDSNVNKYIFSGYICETINESLYTKIFHKPMDFDEIIHCIKKDIS